MPNNSGHVIIWLTPRKTNKQIIIIISIELRTAQGSSLPGLLDCIGMGLEVQMISVIRRMEAVSCSFQHDLSKYFVRSWLSIPVYAFFESMVEQVVRMPHFLSSTGAMTIIDNLWWVTMPRRCGVTWVWHHIPHVTMGLSRRSSTFPAILWQYLMG